MELHFVGTISVFVYYLYSKKVKSEHAHYAHVSVAPTVDGMFIAQSSHPRTLMLLHSKN